MKRSGSPLLGQSEVITPQKGLSPFLLFYFVLWEGLCQIHYKLSRAKRVNKCLSPKGKASWSNSEELRKETECTVNIQGCLDSLRLA